MLGAAWSTVFTECVITAGCLHTLRRPAAETGSRLAPAVELAKSRAALLEGDAP
jgi:hypothetical protein